MGGGAGLVERDFFKLGECGWYGGGGSLSFSSIDTSGGCGEWDGEKGSLVISGYAEVG